MANLRTIQLLRNAQVYGSLETAKTTLETQARTLLDGSPVVGRYTVDDEVRSIFGIVHVDANDVHTVSFFMNEITL